MVGQQPGALVVRVQHVGADGQDATGPENIGGKSGRNLDRENDVIQPQDIRGAPCLCLFRPDNAPGSSAQLGLIYQIDSLAFMNVPTLS